MYYLAWTLALSLVLISAISLCEYFSVLTHNAVAILKGDSYRQICEKNGNKLLANEVFSQRMVVDRRKTWTREQRR